MFIKLFLLFTIIPVIELFTLVKIGTIIGFPYTLAIVLLTGGIGAYLTKKQGLQVWIKLQNELKAHRFPANELIDGLLLLIAGLVLITPGVFTDLVGFTLLIPFTRSHIKVFVRKKIGQMVTGTNVRYEKITD